MGTTTQNVYLFPAPGKDELADGLRLSLESLSYESVEPDEVFDIVFEVNGQDGEGSYASIEAGGIDDVEGFIKDLSNSLACDVLHASLFDSDYLLLAYHSHQLGRSTTVGVGMPEWEEDEIRQGEFDSFLELLDSGANREELKAIWDTHYASADERLYGMLPLLGHQGSLYSSDADPHTLRYRCSASGSYELIHEGLPQLRCHIKSLTVHNKGKEYLFIENSGGPSKGLTILLYGESIGELMDIPEQCGQINLRGYLNPTVRHTFRNEPNRFSMAAGFYPYTSSEGVQTLRADFPDVPIPEGLVIDRSRRYNYAPVYAEFEDYFRIIAQFEFAITKPIGIEKLDLAMQVSPYDNKGNSSIHIFVELILGN
ncbi:MAG: hypothetical protein FWH40_08580 [Coriobacteriia bacterium]|nr:hypothetical protein [Coriobacteriia bacterium]